MVCVITNYLIDLVSVCGDTDLGGGTLNNTDRTFGTLSLVVLFIQNFILGIYGKCLWYFRSPTILMVR